MPLLVRSENKHDWKQVAAESGRRLLDEVYEAYKDSSKDFLTLPNRLVIPQGSLYVGQRELAVVPQSHADHIGIVGSDDATTCHVLILRHEGSGTSAVCHFDGADSALQLRTLLRSIIRVLKDIEAIRSTDLDPLRFTTHIIGGFNDARFISEGLSEELLWLLHYQTDSIVPAGIGPINFQLKTACISVLNTINGPRGEPQKDGIIEPLPAVFGAAIDVKTGDVFPCIFDDRGPEAPLRMARVFSAESDLMNIYEHKTKRITIGPFSYYTMGNSQHLLEVPDEWILQNMSTSPKAEPPHFANAVREMVKFSIDNPNWRDVFAKGCIEYEWKTGQGWTKCA